jgi:hypothetical protein
MQPLLTPNELEAEMFARLAMFAVVVMAFAIGSQARAAPLSYGTYYDEELVVENCTNASICRSNFSQLPSDNLFLLKKVNCVIISSQPLISVFCEHFADFRRG